jgi:hypothetical protein
MFNARLKGILAVWVILVLFHFSTYSLAVVRKFSAHSEIEFSQVESALFNKPVDDNALAAPRREKKKQALIEKILEFPLLPLLHTPEPGKEYYHGLSIPIEMRFANSMAAGVFWYLVGFFITAFLPVSSRWRRFFEGRALSAKEVPRVFDKAPIIAASRFLQKSEKTRHGPVIIVGFFHILLTGAANVFAVAARFDSFNAPTPLLVKLVRLPLTPLLVSEDFWTSQYQSAYVQPLVAVANSALVGVIAAVVLSLLKRSKDNSDDPPGSV